MSRPRYLNSTIQPGHPVIENLPPLPVKKRRPKVDSGTRLKVYERDEYRCRYCGVYCTEDNITIDHVIPLSKGGKNVKKNMVTACTDCNRDKADKKLRPLPPRACKKRP